jgi:hypothetical protein
MKYTFESSEKEVTALYGLLKLVVQEFAHTVRHSNELRAARSPLSGSLKTPVTVSADSEGRDADVIEFPRSATRRKTEEEVEDAVVYETEPVPASAKPVVADEEPPKQTKEQKRIEKGRKAFDEFIQAWLVGIDHLTMLPIEGVKQPNRDQMLRDLQNGRYGYASILYVKSCGGLQCAIADVTGSQDLAVALAPYIVPPASIAFSDLADTYEYVNPFKKDED